MANLQLIGAVGVRVRPDTKGFRNETKREILAQLQDIEGDANVRVKPNVEYDKVAAQRALKNAFKDLEAAQKIKVTPEVDDRAYQQALTKLARQQIANPTPVRIEADTKDAQAAIKDLNNEINDLESDLSRLPKQAKDLDEQYAKSFKAIKETIKTAEKAVENYNADVADATRRQGALKEAILEQAEAYDKANQKIGEAEAWHKAYVDSVIADKGKITKAAEKESYKRVKIAQDEAKAQKLILTQLEGHLKKSDKELGSLNNKLTQQQKIIKDQLKTEQERGETYRKTSDEIQKQITLSEERIELARAEIVTEEHLQQARTRSTKQLTRMLTEGNLTLRDYNQAVRDNLTDAGGYFQWLGEIAEETGGQLSADMQEYRQRVNEAGRWRREQYQEEVRLRRQLRINGETGISEYAPYTNWDVELNRAKAYADQASEYISSRTPAMTVETRADPATLAFTEAKLDTIARPRTAEIFAKLMGRNSTLIRGDMDPIDLPINLKFLANGKALAGDIFEAFSGMGTARGLSKDLKNALAGFDSLALTAGQVALAITAIGAAGAASLGLVTSLANDLGEIVGLALTAPAILTGLAAGIYTTIKGFDQFNEAANGNADALKTFNKDGREAARAVGRIYDELDKIVKPRLWEGIGSNMTEMARAIREPVVEGMGDAAEEVGRLWGGIFRSFTKFAESGDMKTAFDNMQRGFAELSNAGEPFFDALNRMGLIGSKYLDNMGRSLSNMARDFRDWTNTNSDNGNFDAWIQEAIRNTRMLGEVAVDTTGFVRGIGNAAQKGGFNGLESVRDSMDALNRAANGKFFQANGATIFAGSLQAMRDVGAGLRDLGRAFLEESAFISLIMGSTGRTLGNIFSNIADTFSNNRMLTGIGKFFADMEEISVMSGPIFDKLAAGMGDFSTLAGEVLKGAVLVADAFLTVWTNSDHLTSSMEKLIPYLADVTAGLVEITHVPIDLLSEGLAYVIDGFLSLNETVGYGLLAMGAMALFGPKLMALGRGAVALAGRLTGVTAAADRFRGVWGEVMRTQDRSKATMLANSQLLTAQQRQIARAALNWRDATTRMQDWRQGVQKTNARVADLTGRLAMLRTNLNSVSANLANSPDRKDLQRHYDRLTRDVEVRAGQLANAHRLAQVKSFSAATRELGNQLATVGGLYARAGLDAGRAMASALGTEVRNAAVRTVREFRTMGREVAGHMAQQGRAMGRGMVDNMAHAIRQFSLADALDPSRLVTPYFNQAMNDLRSQLREMQTYARAAATDAARQTRQAFTNAFGRDAPDAGYANLDRMLGPNIVGEAQTRGGLAGRAFSAAFGDSIARTRDAVSNTLGGAMTQAQSRMALSAVAMRADLERVRNSAQNTARSISDSGRAFSSWASNLAPVQGAARAISGVNSALSNMAGAMRAVSTAGITGALRNVVIASGQAAGALAGAGSASVAGAARGLMGALGGPWGLAITAATTALIVLGQKAADQRAKIEGLKETLSDVGEVTQDTATNIANLMNDESAGLGDNWLAWGDTVGETLVKIGTDSKQMADMMVNNRPAFDEFKKALDNAVQMDTPEAWDTFGQKIGMTGDAAKRFAPELSFLSTELGKHAGYVDSAESSWAALNGAAEPASAATQALGDAFGVLGDEASGADDKVRALNAILEQMSGIDLSLEDSMQRFNDAARAAGEGIPDIAAKVTEAYGDIGAAIDDNTGKIDTNKAAGSELRTSMQGMTQAAEDHAIVMSEQGKSQQEIAKYLGESKEAYLDNFRAMGLGQGTIDELGKAYDRLAQGAPEEIATTLTIKGMDAVDEAEALFNKLDMEWNQKDFEAWLKLDGTQAAIEGKSAQEIAQLWADTQAVAKFDVDAEGVNAAKSEVESLGLAWDGKEFKAWLQADPENAKLAATDSEAAARAFADSVYKANLEADGTIAKSVIEGLKADGVEFETGALTKFIEANAERFYNEKTPVDQIIEEFKQQPAEVRLGALDETAEGKNSAQAQVDAFRDQPAAKAKLETENRAAEGIAAAIATIESTYMGTPWKADLETADKTIPGLTDAKGSIDMNWQGTAWEAMLTGRDHTAPGISGAQASAGTQWQGNQYNAQLGAGHAGVGIAAMVAQGIGQGWGISEWIGHLSGETSGVSAAKGRADGMGGAHAGTTHTGHLSSETGGVSAAKGRADGMGGQHAGTTHTGHLDSETSGVSAAKGAADGMGATHSSTTHTGHLSAETSGVSAAFETAMSIGRSWAVQAFTATLSAVAKALNANGNLLIGAQMKPIAFAEGGLIKAMNRLGSAFGTGIQAFANGGFSDSTFYNELAKKNAAGSKEDHTARIFTAKSPYRIFAEPETFGESYIPLAASKRARSTKIWEETGKRLGVNWEAYADGGIDGGVSNSRRGAGRNGKTTNVHIVNNYPQAEPTSVSTNRALQFAANLG